LVDLLTGTTENDILIGQGHQNIFIGYQGADLFVLPTTSYGAIGTADIIIDFSITDGDLIQLPTAIPSSEIAFRPVDMNGDGTLDGTSIEEVGKGVYAVALNSLDMSGTTILSFSQFA
jgi:Ca2+-binding RTX toxin-like protein